MYRNGQAIAGPRDGEDGQLIFVPDSLAQLRDGRSERSIDHGRARPDGFEKLIFGDNFTGMLKKMGKHFQGLRFEINRAATYA